MWLVTSCMALRQPFDVVIGIDEVCGTLIPRARNAVERVEQPNQPWQWTPLKPPPVSYESGRRTSRNETGVQRVLVVARVIGRLYTPSAQRVDQEYKMYSSSNGSVCTRRHDRTAAHPH